ncbi:hypothetical protein ACFL0G_05795 [Candidatus Zixiibacteriota bacterium]
MTRRKRSRRGRFTPVVWALLAMVLLGGCASAKFIRTGPSVTAKPDDCHIEIFSSKLPDREYEELGILEGEGFLGADSLEEVLPKMKQEACRAGGDAIILKSSQKSFDGEDTNLNVTATVVRWTD